MNFQLSLIRTYFKIYSALAPKSAGRRSFQVFQKVRKKDIRPREAAFFKAANHFQLDSTVDQIDYYSMGNPENPLVFLVHGWDSNAGSLSKIAEKLVELNKYVVLFNLPAHAFSTKNQTNLLECKIAFQTVLKKLNPIVPFSVVSHSFGSAVVSYALSETPYKVDKLIFLTNPNRVEHIFEEFKNTIHLGDKAYQELIRIAEKKLGEPIGNVSVEKKLVNCDFNQLVLIYDKFDKVLPSQNSIEVKLAFPDAIEVSFEKIGHYKMLWNKEVIEACVLHLN